MGEVIGYKGTPGERLTEWKSMLNFKKYQEVFKNTNDPWELKVLKRSNYNYKKFLKEYKRAA